MAQFQPPPTWASPVEVDEKSGRAQFHPVWLKWFIDLAVIISSSGGGGGSIVHNDTTSIQGGSATQRFHLSTAAAALVTGNVWTTWSPSRTNWTDVGAAPTVTGRYAQINQIVAFSIKVVPGTSIATTAGSSYTSLPPLGAANDLGLATMTNLTTGIAVGVCMLDPATDHCYVPAQAASGNTFIISGIYEGP